jgi:hypothetical protein
LGREDGPEPITPTPAEPATPQPQLGQPQPAAQPAAQPQPSATPLPDPAAARPQASWQRTAAAPVFPRNQHNPAPMQPAATPATSTPGLIGPIGYDVQK